LSVTYISLRMQYLGSIIHHLTGPAVDVDGVKVMVMVET
jgi:hypothetical protein